MVIIKKKEINRKSYYYLEHSFKLKSKIEKKELYLGTSIPKNIEKIKQEFMHNLFKERYFKFLNNIKDNFLEEFRKMPKTAEEKYLDYFMIKFTYNTNRIEGSTLTLKETANLLEEGISPKNRPIEDVKETEAHKKLFYEMMNHKGDINYNTVLYWHKLLLQDTKPDIAGKIRNHQIKIARSKAEFPFPAELNLLIKEFFNWYNLNKNKLHPVELAALAHLKFVSIHPFTDGNGRISRLMMNFILNKYKYPMLNIKYINRDNYYNSLERSQLTKKEYIFVQHIIKRYLKEYKKYLN